jgi:hypothetical protein
MLIKEDMADLATPTGLMRTYRFMPAASGPYPGLVLFCENLSDHRARAAYGPHPGQPGLYCGSARGLP